jgi:hypothetical protein
VFEDYIKILEQDNFDEYPVPVEEFVYGKHYLGLNVLSDYQMEIVKAGSQILKEEDLIKIYGEVAGKERYQETFKEVILMLGKGSGKDFTSTITISYIVYQLLCLKDPSAYFGQAPGEHIDIINIAINAQQAKNVFFKGFKKRIETSPWFVGKFEAKTDSIEFDKDITVYSGHSERESWEGYNTFAVVLDEIAGFAVDNATGNERAKTAEDVYDMYSASVVSRFPDYGKVILLSFPRYRGDFISQRYDAVVADKQVVEHFEQLIVNPELPDEDWNRVEFMWEEDIILGYKQPYVYALKRPSWIINPTKKIEDYTGQFFKNITDSMMRFACMPPDAIDGLFKEPKKIDDALSRESLFDEHGTKSGAFLPDKSKEYFVHADLAQVFDRCAVAIAHVDHFTEVRYGKLKQTIEPVVVVDFVRWWSPSKDKSIDLKEVREFIVSLKAEGYNIKLVTFDRWNSVEMMEYLDQKGFKTDRVSVAKPHYIDLLTIVNEGRLHGPNIDLLKTELKQLRVIKDKIDHPRKGSKDLADAVCGAVYNAIVHTPKEEALTDISPVVYGDVTVGKVNALEEPPRPKPSKVPADVQAFLDSMTVI